MRPFPFRHLPILVFSLPLAALGTACRKAEPPRTSPPGARTTPTAATVAPHGLDLAELRRFYHQPEGSESLPRFLLALAVQPNGRPFLENLERFGLLTDASPENPDNLPVGVTMTVPRDLARFNVRMMGFNCAACHVGELTGAGQTVRIIGAPARFDIRRFYAELGASLKPLLGTTRGVLEVVRAFYAELTSRHQPDDALEARKEMLARAVAERPDANGFGASLRRDLERLRQEVHRRPDVELRRFDPLSTAAPPPPPVAPSQRTMRLLGEDAPPAAALSVFASPGLRRKAALLGLFGDVHDVLRLLEARRLFVDRVNGQGATRYTPPGPGRVDAFMTALNLMFEARAPMDSPVSYPHLWNTSSLPFVHWDNNTNSIMERNMGQAIGLGAVFDAETHASTLLPAEIHALELLLPRLQAPRWPFGALDADQIARGGGLFERHCAGCHAPPGGQFVVDEAVGTDPLRLRNFETRVDGMPAYEKLGRLLAAVKAKAYATKKISPAQQLEMEGQRTPVVWRAPVGYAPRSLAGTWATAPYLHNNSVPTLADLLLLEVGGEKPRPAIFILESGFYDLERGGLRIRRHAGPDAFDTRHPGNSNAGHRYGTTLPDADKRALLEYLKSL